MFFLKARDGWVYWKLEVNDSTFKVILTCLNLNMFNIN